LPFSQWHVHANMNFPYSPALSCVTRCRTGIRGPWSTDDVETSTNTRTVEQGLYRRMDRSGFAVELRINRRCGKADMRCFAYDRPSRISDVVRAPLNLPRENKQGNSTVRDILPKLSSILSLFFHFSLGLKYFSTGEKV